MCQTNMPSMAITIEFWAKSSRDRITDEGHETILSYTTRFPHDAAAVKNVTEFAAASIIQTAFWIEHYMDNYTNDLNSIDTTTRGALSFHISTQMNGEYHDDHVDFPAAW